MKAKESLGGGIKIDPHILNEAGVYNYIHTSSQKLG